MIGLEIVVIHFFLNIILFRMFRIHKIENLNAIRLTIESWNTNTQSKRIFAIVTTSIHLWAKCTWQIFQVQRKHGASSDETRRWWVLWAAKHIKTRGTINHRHTKKTQTHTRIYLPLEWKRESLQTCKQTRLFGYLWWW